MLKENEFRVIQTKIFGLTGIHLGDHKKTLAYSRVSRRMNALNLDDISSYLNYLEKNPKETSSFINSLTTNKTEFFREVDHFHFLAKHLEEREKDNVLLTWSAACSTGQEIYSLASLYEGLKRRGQLKDYRFLGSDIDTDVLGNAMTGIYPAEQLEVNPMPPQAFSIWDKTDQDIIIKDAYKEKIKWRQVNLMDPSLKSSIKFDIIFLRNVLIYFERPTIQKTIQALLPYLKNDGLLFISHSESLNGMELPLKQVFASVYAYDR